MKGKGNDGTGDNIERDLWETKQELFDTLKSQYNFTFDCCASGENKKCSSYSNQFESIDKFALEEDVCWMNPPFSKANQMFEHFFKVVKRGVAIFRCDNMETKVWQDIILKHADWVFIPKGRIRYSPFKVSGIWNKQGTRFPSALIGIGVSSPNFINGVVLIIDK